MTTLFCIAFVLLLCSIAWDLIDIIRSEMKR